MKMNAMMFRVALAALFMSVARGGDPSRVSFKVVSPMKGYSHLWGLAEGSPGVFYGGASLVSSGSAAYSVTKQGTATMLASFPTHYYIGKPLVAGPNWLFYADVQHVIGIANLFSVGAVPGTVQVYADQAVGPLLSQSLPNSTFLGVAANAQNQLPWSVVTVDLSGNITQVYQFVDDVPISNALYATDGNYYGIAAATPGYVY